MREEMSRDYDSIRIVLSLERLGELVAHVAAKYADQHGLEPPDFEGEEMRELAISSWQHVLFMADRSEFAASVADDLAKLDSPAES